MISLKKVAISAAAASMILAPVAATAAPAMDGARALSVTEGQNELGGSGWFPAILALAIIAGGVWLAVDGDNDAPVSP